MVLSTIQPPEKLTKKHNVEDFDSGVEVLNLWLKEKALKNEVQGAARTYVVCADDKVIGYFCLAVGNVSRAAATKRAGRNMPNPIPVMVLGRLAVDKEWQGMGIGRGLVKEAILRTLQASDVVGIKALLVHAKSEEAKAFYENLGFSLSPTEPMTLMITLQDALAALEQEAA